MRATRSRQGPSALIHRPAVRHARPLVRHHARPKHADPSAPRRHVVARDAAVVVTSADHPRDPRSILFVSPTLARWLAIVAGSVVVIVLALLAAGFWAKRRVLNL
jgi:hypothetical protein